MIVGVCAKDLKIAGQCHLDEHMQFLFAYQQYAVNDASRLSYLIHHIFTSLLSFGKKNDELNEMYM